MLPLHMASLGGYTDCCRKLISYGEYLSTSTRSLSCCSDVLVKVAEMIMK